MVQEDVTTTGTCQKCSNDCKTCGDNPSVCTSCNAGFEFRGSSCISNDRVTVTAKLDITLAQFIDFQDLLSGWLVDQVKSVEGSRSTFTKSNVILSGVSSGSVNVNTVLSMPNSNAVGTVANKLTTAMNSGNEKIGGALISGSAVGSTSSNNNQTTTNS